MRVAIACGGTGGHLFPGLAVADVLIQRGHEVLVFISEKEIDALATRGRTDVRFEKLPAIGMPPLFSPAIVPFIAGFLGGFRRCSALFDSFRPDAVLGMGGFTSTAPVLAGRARGVPAFVHESNAIPGKANKLTARFCTAVLLGFPDCAAYFPGSRCEVVGTPVRKSLLAPVDVAATRARLGLDEGRMTLLIMGGSQGAQGLNRAVSAALAGFPADELQVIHFTGKQGEEPAREEYRRQGRVAHVAAFHHEMQEAYALADLVISRSGAASLTEMSWFGLPSVLIPYPFAADDHQTRNAQIFVRAGAGLLCKEENALAGDLSNILRGLLAKPEMISAMAAAARSLSPADAAGSVVDLMERSCVK